MAAAAASRLVSTEYPRRESTATERYSSKAATDSSGRPADRSVATQVVVDYGQARQLGVAGRLCLAVCGDDFRLVDPEDCDAASDATEGPLLDDDCIGPVDDRAAGIGARVASLARSLSGA